MKKFIIPSIAALFLAACGSTAPRDTSELAELQKEKDSLVSLSQEITAQIAELDESISKLDTAAKRALVSVVAAEQRSFEHYFSVHGIVQANKNVTLFSESAGTITGVLVKEGQRVRTGQVLVELDADVMKSQLKEIETSLELATELYERQKRLWDQKIGSEVDYLNAKNRKEGLEQSKATLERQIKMAQVVAPSSGVVDEIFPRQGEYVGSSSPVVRLVNLDQPYLESEVTEAYVGRIGAKTLVRIAFPALDTVVEATISRAGDYINPNNRTFKVEINLDQMKGLNVKPNMLAVVHIRDYSSEEAVTLPSRMVQQTADGSSYVYVASQGTDIARVEMRAVQPGRSYDGYTEILKGIQPNEFVVDQGARSIRPDQQVRVVANPS
ncbi:MAG: efflux RND transporter periplasmic adaptor subunit [Flavobacteriales bacterium]|nr:efflux RND transporter periplasmic adaptor subunit [Flavobacteriales bacterium]